MKRKICIVLTARASYTKLRPILRHLHAHPQVELQVVCAASAVLDRFGNVVRIVEQDGFKVNECLHFLIEGETVLTTCKSAGIGLAEFAGSFDRLRPDLVVVMADRYEVLSAAIAAAYQNIPLAHIQGGEVSGNIDEKVRHAITKLADYHFAATARARDWLIRMGEIPERVFHTGCPSIDLAAEALGLPGIGSDIYVRYGGVGFRPTLDSGYIIVMQHPVTDEIETERKNINETLYALKDSQLPVLWFWPNPDAGSDDVSKAIRAFREKHNPQQMHFFKNMEPLDFLRLLANSHGIIGNSSAGIREASFLGIPAINIGSRQRNRERGPNVIDVAYDRVAICAGIRDHFTGRKPQSFIYGNGNAGGVIGKTLVEVPLSSSKEIGYIFSGDRLNATSNY